MPLGVWLIVPVAAGFALLWAWEAGGGVKRVWMIVCVLWLGALLWAAASPRVRFFGSVFFRVRTDSRIVALTFDDGPNEPVTSRLLDLLKEEGVPATFFLVGENARAFPDTVRRIAREGHDVGNHTYRHLPLVFLDAKTMGREIDRTQEILSALTGRAPRLLRPPFGLRDVRVLAAARARGLKVVEWSVWGGDAFSGRFQRPAAGIVRKVEDSLEPGAVILLHDGDMARVGVDKSRILPVVAGLIPELRARGYRFVTLSQMLGIGDALASYHKAAPWVDMRIGACALVVVIQWAAVFLFWRRLRRRARPSSYRPAAAVLVACKGRTDDLGENISSFLRQDYGARIDYFFVTPSRQDPAYEEASRVLAEEPGARTELLASGVRPLHCSEQNLNLLFAYERLPAHSEVLVFADCDVRVTSNWIRELISGLETGSAAVSSAAALYVPRDLGWGGLFRMLWQSVGLPYLSLAPVATGSSLAIRRKDFEELGMPERWKKDVTADAVLDLTARKAGKKIAFMPAAMPVSRADCSLREFLAQFNKWVLFCKLYARPLWLAGALAVAGKIALWILVLRPPASGLCAALLILGDVFQAYFVIRILLSKLPDRFARLHPLYKAYPLLAALAAPLLLAAYAAHFLSSLIKKEIVWGGYVYRIHGPGKVEVVG